MPALFLLVQCMTVYHVGTVCAFDVVIVCLSYCGVWLVLLENSQTESSNINLLKPCYV